MMTGMVPLPVEVGQQLTLVQILRPPVVMVVLVEVARLQQVAEVVEHLVMEEIMVGLVAQVFLHL